MRTTEEDCIRALEGAANVLGRSPSKVDYEALEVRPAASTIRRVMGSWNEAKAAAGLETYEPGAGGDTTVLPKPDAVELPPGHDWDKLNPQQRWYYKNRSHRIAVKSRRKADLRRWFTEYKRDECECRRCGETHPACLDFHHVDGKRLAVSEMVSLGYAKETIVEEMDACVVLCANCHRKAHHSLGYESAESDTN